MNKGKVNGSYLRLKKIIVIIKKKLIEVERKLES